MEFSANDFDSLESDKLLNFSRKDGLIDKSFYSFFYTYYYFLFFKKQLLLPISYFFSL
jgi:hypothetical protein